MREKTTDNSGREIREIDNRYLNIYISVEKTNKHSFYKKLHSFRNSTNVN
jgi:hypothetical protein